jgi:phosphoserine aminotransferase
MRIHNFSAGPGALPESVLREAQSDLLSHAGTGIGIAECSHRSPQFDQVIGQAKERIRALLRLDDDQVVLFLHGGARSQFYMWPMNVLSGGRAAYLDTGHWARLAAKDATRYGEVDVVFSAQEAKDTFVPSKGQPLTVDPATRYVHYTSNNTIAGTEFHHVPTPSHGGLVCDMSSNFLSRPIDGSRFEFIYAGAQKNVGPSGTTVVILRKSTLDSCNKDLPDMLRYDMQVHKDGMLNTPTTFSIYMIERVTAWIEAQGGLKAIEDRNIAQAGRLYDTIDSSSLFRGRVQTASRSRMNIAFTTGDDDRDTRFWQSASNEGLNGLKGHRNMGGLRASLYNAQTDQAVDALIAYMQHFEQRTMETS